MPIQGDQIVNGQSANAYIIDGKIFFRVDARYRDGTAISSRAIVLHEAFHNAAQYNAGLVEQGMEIVRLQYQEEQVRAMKDAYREAYKKLYFS